MTVEAVGPRTGDPAIDRFLPVPGSLADHIYAVVVRGSTDEADMAWAAAATHDILAMPEMRAIAELLHNEYGEYSNLLPRAVIQWVSTVGATT